MKKETNANGAAPTEDDRQMSVRVVTNCRHLPENRDVYTELDEINCLIRTVLDSKRHPDGLTVAVTSYKAFLHLLLQLVHRGIVTVCLTACRHYMSIRFHEEMVATNPLCLTLRLQHQQIELTLRILRNQHGLFHSDRTVRALRRYKDQYFDAADDADRRRVKFDIVIQRKDAETGETKFERALLYLYCRSLDNKIHVKALRDCAVAYLRDYQEARVDVLFVACGGIDDTVRHAVVLTHSGPQLFDCRADGGHWKVNTSTYVFVVASSSTTPVLHPTPAVRPTLPPAMADGNGGNNGPPYTGVADVAQNLMGALGDANIV